MYTRFRQGTANDVLVVDCVGELDQASADDVFSELMAAVRGHSCRLVIDLSAVQFIDSSGLRALVAVSRRAASLGGWVRLAAPLSIVWALLSSTDIHYPLPVYRSVRRATQDPG